MKKSILAITKEQGLNQNLLRLALSPWREAVSMIELGELTDQIWDGFEIVIVDQQAMPNPDELLKIFSNKKKNAKFLYLMDRAIDEKIQQELHGWYFLTKPFTPKTLQELIER